MVKSKAAPAPDCTWCHLSVQSRTHVMPAMRMRGRRAGAGDAWLIPKGPSAPAWSLCRGSTLASRSLAGTTSGRPAAVAVTRKNPLPNPARATVRRTVSPAWHATSSVSRCTGLSQQSATSTSTFAFVRTAP